MTPNFSYLLIQFIKYKHNSFYSFAETRKINFEIRKKNFLKCTFRFNLCNNQTFFLQKTTTGRSNSIHNNGEKGQTCDKSACKCGLFQAVA